MVEIYRDGQWHAICDRNWSMKEAGVVCRQLGYGDARKVYNSGEDSYESGRNDADKRDDTPIAISDVSCIGTERTLASCKIEEWSVTNQCGDIDNVGVVCKGPCEYSVNSILVGFYTPTIPVIIRWNTLKIYTLYARNIRNRNLAIINKKLEGFAKLG